MTETADGAPGAVLTTDREAIAWNLRSLRTAFAPSRIMLVVKADAYGHGLRPVYETALAEGVEDFAALDIETGAELRSLGAAGTLFVWRIGPSSDFALAQRAGLELGVQSRWQLERIATLDPAEGRLAVHLKLDTGLHRGGADPAEWDALVDAALALQREGRLRVRGAWTHFSDTSPEDDERSFAQFTAAVDRARGRGAEFEVLHAAASGAGIDFPESRLDFVRLGLGAYGISPFEDRDGRDLGLRPALELTAPVLSVAESEAAVGVGFGDGLQSAPDGEMWLSIDGAPHPIRRVEVDRTIVDRVPGIDIGPGSLAYCFGDGEHGEATAERWAEAFRTVPDEIVTGVTARVTRRIR